MYHSTNIYFKNVIVIMKLNGPMNRPWAGFSFVKVSRAGFSFRLNFARGKVSDGEY
jgi:hypothetical protein